MARSPVAPAIYSLQVQQLHWMLRLAGVDSRIDPLTLQRLNTLTNDIMRILLDAHRIPFPAVAAK